MSPGARCSSNRNSGASRGLTILELLVSLAIISLLMALLLPTLAGARETARKIECTSHLKQLGLALHAYHDVHRSLPAGWQYERTRQTATGWSVGLLPFVEQQALQQRVDRNCLLTDARLELCRNTSLPLFRCPSDLSDPVFPLEVGAGLHLYPAASYVGVYGTEEPDDIRPTPAGDGTFINVRPVRFSEMTRGMSQIMVIGERTVAMFPSTWIGFEERDEDAQCRVVGQAFRGPNCQDCDECEFSSRHPGVSLFLWGDGHVAGQANSVDRDLYRKASQRHADSDLQALVGGRF